jgi:hypothetical protein
MTAIIASPRIAPQDGVSRLSTQRGHRRLPAAAVAGIARCAILGIVAWWGTPSCYAAAADLLVAAHFCYVAFAVGGELVVIAGALARWRWVRNLPFRIAHLCAVVLVAVEASIGVPCPLTEWEYELRGLAGQRAEVHVSFIARIVRSIIFYDFPAWVFLVAYIGFAAFVALTLVLVRPRWPRSRTGVVRGNDPPRP